MKKKNLGTLIVRLLCPCDNECRNKKKVEHHFEYGSFLIDAHITILSSVNLKTNSSREYEVNFELYFIFVPKALLDQ